MKKKTVITTEKREVWVIRRQLDSSQESGQESNVGAVPPPVDPQGSNRSLAIPPEQPQPEDVTLENE